jgi:peptide deformylase
MEEGCLSLPGIYAKVTRPEEITIEGCTLEGEEVSIEAEGLVARCLLHEYDHLDGILFIDKVSQLRKRTLKKKLKKLEETYKEKQRSVTAK